jgi:hypothetical protein
MLNFAKELLILNRNVSPTYIQVKVSLHRSLGLLVRELQGSEAFFVNDVRFCAVRNENGGMGGEMLAGGKVQSREARVLGLLLVCARVDVLDHLAKVRDDIHVIVIAYSKHQRRVPMVVGQIRVGTQLE